jgi:hypothetical protein
MSSDLKRIDWAEPRYWDLPAEWKRNGVRIRSLSREIYDVDRLWPVDETRLAELCAELQRLRERQAAIERALGLDLEFFVRTGDSGGE